jgi:hypothetical protein
MPDVRTFGRDDEYTIRYLLGLLPDEEAERIDEASIVDDDLASRLRVIESDLVDSYVSGTLAGETLARFETFYLSSPLRREKVTFAERFLDAIDRATAPPVTVPARRRTRFQWPVAAAVFLLTTCGILLVEDVRLRNGLSQARHASAASDLRGQALARQLEQSRVAAAEARQALENAHTAPMARGSSVNGRSLASPGPVPLALVLMPQTRAIGPLPTVAVSKALAHIAVDLRLESNDFPRYRVDLKDPGSDRPLWRRDAVPARSVPEGSFVSIVVPADMLASQHYVLELAGLDSAGRVETVASYTFQIIRP